MVGRWWRTMDIPMEGGEKTKKVVENNTYPKKDKGKVVKAKIIGSS